MKAVWKCFVGLLLLVVLYRAHGEVQLTETLGTWTLKKGTSNVKTGLATYPACKDAAKALATSTATKYTCNVSNVVVVVTAPGQVTISWKAPTQNTDGTPLTDLAGFTVWQSIAGVSGYTSVNIANPGATSITLSNLKPGTYTWNVTAYNTAGVKSDASVSVSKTIQ